MIELCITYENMKFPKANINNDDSNILLTYIERLELKWNFNDERLNRVILSIQYCKNIITIITGTPIGTKYE